MIDWGLIALILVLISLIGLNFHAWRSVILERDRIVTSGAATRQSIEGMEAAIKRALDLADNAHRTAEAVKTSNYTRVLEKLQEVEATLSKYESVVSNLQSRIISTNARISAAMRSGRGLAKVEEAPEEEYGAANQIQMEIPAAAAVVPKSFGRKMA